MCWWDQSNQWVTWQSHQVKAASGISSCGSIPNELPRGPHFSLTTDHPVFSPMMFLPPDNVMHKPARWKVGHAAVFWAVWSYSTNRSKFEDHHWVFPPSVPGLQNAAILSGVMISGLGDESLKRSIRIKVKPNILWSKTASSFALTTTEASFQLIATKKYKTKFSDFFWIGQ